MYDTFSTFQSAKTEASIDKIKPPYLHDYYNIQFYFYPPLNQIHSVEALNNKHKLPKYIIMLVDRDIISGALDRILMKVSNRS